MPDFWPDLDEAVRADCPACGDMGERLVCQDDGTWVVVECEECMDELLELERIV